MAPQRPDENSEPETTRRNLRLVREAREKRGEHDAWAAAIETALENSEKAVLARNGGVVPAG